MSPLRLFALSSALLGVLISYTMIPSTAVASPFYSNALFSTVFSPLAVVYSAVAHLACFCARPFPSLRLEPRKVPFVPVTSKKVVIVTGSNTGIGFETSKALVERGYEVILACRSREKGIKAVEQIQQACAGEHAGEAVFVHPLDLGSFDSVREFSKVILGRYNKIDALVNNAGTNGDGQSERNLDMCFQTNFLGHFLLTQQLMPALINDGRGRVINLSSVTHHFCGNGAKDEAWWLQQATYGKAVNSYSSSKLAAILFSMELNRRFASKGLRSIVVNPGSVLSDIWRDYPRLLVQAFKLVYISPEKGSYTSVAAVVDEFSPETLYLQPYRLFDKSKVPFPAIEMLGPFVGYQDTKPRLPNDGSNGSKTAQALWNVSEKLVDCKFQ